MHAVKLPKKLIEVALPLDAINKAAAHEKMPGIGPHPRGLHLWWARRPLAAARAVLFGQMVNDPSWKWEMEHPGELPPGHLKATWAKSRRRLFTILEDLVKWENITNEDVLERARAEILKSWEETCEVNCNHPDAAKLFNPERLPGFHDPFAGGGALPLEAQRLGLDASAADLNPVAVIINKAMIEIPPRFAGLVPVGPAAEQGTEGALDIGSMWSGSAGLAEDVRRYGAWMQQQAEDRIGHLYPKVLVTAEMAAERPDLNHYIGRELAVIASLWARTVKSPNPAFQDVDVPLVSTFILSNKDGKGAYVVPVIEGQRYHFVARPGAPENPEAAKMGTRAGKAQDFLCLMSGTPISRVYIREEGKAGRLGERLMAVVAEGDRGRIYLSPSASGAVPHLGPAEEDVVKNARSTFLSGSTPTRAMVTGGVCSAYGLSTWGHLFTSRQLVALTTLSDLVHEARALATRGAAGAGLPDDGVPFIAGGSGATAYGDAIAVYLAFAVDRCADFSNSCTRWVSSNQKVMDLFAKQGFGMTWDFPEAGILHRTVGGFEPAVEFIAECIGKLPVRGAGAAMQEDAASSDLADMKVVSTDPPYYDNIAYADLSDFFYVWLRRSLRPVFPDLLATVVTPKAEELVATPHRHGSQEAAEAFFLEGMTQAMDRLARFSHPAFPVTVYYAFKQSQTDGVDGTASTGWETFLEAVIRAGFSIGGTWPMRSEQEHRMIGMGTNVLASSIVLVCRPRAIDAQPATRREFQRDLAAVLPQALDDMVRGAEGWGAPVAPVDLSQAIIGPGMAIFSRYAAVLEADGRPMSVRTAMQLINRFLAEDDFDSDSQFCLHWFEQQGWREGRFGDANTLAQAKGTSVDGLRDSGVVVAAGGVVRLLKWAEYPTDWNAAEDSRLPVWEALHHLIRIFRTQGEGAAGQILSAVAPQAPSMRQLAYRLYTLCERAGWAEDARAYNEIITSWSAVEAAATARPTDQQAALFEA